MSSKVITFKNVEIRWAKVFEQHRDLKTFNEDTGRFDLDCPNGGKYVVDVFLDSDQLKELRKSGSKASNSIREDEAGREYVTLRRPHEKYNRKGDLLDWACGAPKVTDEFDQEWNFDERGHIGNDSVADVTLVVYGNKPMIGTRLEAIKVTKAMEIPEKDDEGSSTGGFV